MLAYSTATQSRRNQRFFCAFVPLNKLIRVFPSVVIQWEYNSVVPTMLAELFSDLFPVTFKHLFLVVVMQTQYSNFVSLR